MFGERESMGRRDAVIKSADLAYALGQDRVVAAGMNSASKPSLQLSIDLLFEKALARLAQAFGANRSYRKVQRGQ
jgi:hypothetical protein